MSQHIITVVGLGAMGLPIATNLRNHDFFVRGVDIDEARLGLGREAGLEVFNTALNAVEGADVVLLAVRNHAQLTEVLFGEAGVADRMKDGAAILLISTVGVAAVEETAAVLAEMGIALIDAPVSGGPVRAGEGDLLVTVGAEPAVVDRYRDVLEAMAGNLVIVGGNPGKGQALKTVNQLLCGVHIAAAGEALALAGELGLDQKATLDALMSGAAASFMLGDRGERMLDAYTEEGAEVKSRIDIFVKDMGIVTAAAKSAGIAVPVAASAEQQYLQAFARGMAAQDDSSIITIASPSGPKGDNA
ncbi:NAD(P)-dependent oxidoreductase [Corynebacterium gottingense]|uniref:NAD(P)-dependent oxidoreductase n=1 Tax=Corynebacterium gottingense TaxID=2041036 RepID=A0ABX9UIS3_9CORY|nr:NAD(P)-dependent oxidoreductase [Corynebacterium gottingense]RMD18011.1 NAD(P)-dependent oxidoreductase [Corynebacterium gottingense]WJZ16401.1 2-hydroxy-3-oxopropionate reductase [Corynebacterium gottingense]